MTLPNSLRQQLAFYAKSFGGLQSIEGILSESQLAELALSEDPILLVSPFQPTFKGEESDPINLTSYGFTPNNTFSIYRDNGEFLYRRQSKGGFGDNIWDKRAIWSIDHGHYYQLIEDQSYRRLFLWVYKEPTSDQISRRIKETLRRRDKNLTNTRNELILFFNHSVPNEPVTVYYWEGSQGNLDKTRLIDLAEENEQVIKSRPKDSIYLLPRDNAFWFYAEQAGNPLTISDEEYDIAGLGRSQFNISSEKVFFLDYSRRSGRTISMNTPIRPTSLSQEKKEGNPLSFKIRLHP
jgi:hypothetical protein